MRLPFIKKKEVDNVRRSKKVVKPVRRPSRWLKPLAQGVAMGLVVAAISFGVWKLNTQCSVSYWDIEAAPHVQKQIQAYLEKQKDLDYWHTRASVLQSGLIAHIPDIAHIQINRILPDGLLVQAIARQPMALWKDEQAQVVKLVDEKGVAYRALKRGEMVDLPVLRVSKEALPQAVKLLQALNKYNVRKWLGLSELILADDGWRLNFSHGEQWKVAKNHLEKNLIQVINVLDAPRWAKGHWRIDARIPERWFIRPAKQEVI
jgi:cell division septal protein FtsQ